MRQAGIVDVCNRNTYNVCMAARNVQRYAFLSRGQAK
jgi:hypothetical protein